jgi:putative membrane protein
VTEEYRETRAEPFSITHFLIRFIVGTIVLAITAALTPGFSIAGFWPLLLGAVVLAVLDFLVTRLLGISATPFGRGITGFILAVVIIYITQFFVAGFSVTLFGAILGALIYGVVDLIIPGKAM